jgi:hypothetical protein
MYSIHTEMIKALALKYEKYLNWEKIYNQLVIKKLKKHIIILLVQTI